MTYKIGAKIRSYRSARGLSQKELAELINVSSSRLSNWEKGINRPDVDQLECICKVLQVSPNDLLEIDPKSDNLSDLEHKIIMEYRNKPELQNAVNILLGINT